VAIAAKRILRYYGEPEQKAPLHYRCHWEIRLGHLVPGDDDKWWALTDEASFEPVLTEVTELIVAKAVPVVKDHLTEEGLLSVWEEKVGGFEYPMLKHKSILVAERGEFDKLPAIFERIREICRGGLAQPGAEQHIRSVRERYCLQVQLRDFYSSIFVSSTFQVPSRRLNLQIPPGIQR
jgi:hypothetical protein